ncbi:MAG: 50S ribosomal protein L6 [Lentisphaeria bacterium]|jgi:large subunit ribosomal protein L6|nr:50S ribosomal protein L6 [Lentisphaeria bacterium]MDY0176630.1 50S ribosomal protein L6 [Lentisphaeria bacterium]NLZ59546.1 50S ribosomal protein L6 [Lentisphaerota bacterium]
MSRMGNKEIDLGGKVDLQVEGQAVSVKGPKGTLQYTMPEGIYVEIEGDIVKVMRRDEQRQSKMLHGLARSLISNMVQGVSEGFKQQLELHGVGYRGQVAGRTLTLNLGYSKPVVYEVPEGVEVSMPDQNHISLESIDKQKIGQVTATIRAFRKPDAYHGKGVRFQGEKLSLKEGKTV